MRKIKRLNLDSCARYTYGSLINWWPWAPCQNKRYKASTLLWIPYRICWQTRCEQLSNKRCTRPYATQNWSRNTTRPCMRLHAMYMIPLKMFGLRNMTLASHSARTMEKFSQQRNVSRPIAIAASARSTMKPLRGLSIRTIHCQSWKSKGKNMVLWQPNWAPSMTFPSM